MDSLVIWLGVLKVYWGKIKKWCKIWSETECGKKTLGLCRKNRKILPEDIDPMTGMPVASNPQPLPADAPFIAAWESEDLDGAIEALSAMGINFIGGDDADMAADELGIKPEIVRLTDFAEIM